MLQPGVAAVEVVLVGGSSPGGEDGGLGGCLPNGEVGGRAWDQWEERVGRFGDGLSAGAAVAVEAKGDGWHVVHHDWARVEEEGSASMAATTAR